MAKTESKILSPDALPDIISSGKAETLVFFGEEGLSENRLDGENFKSRDDSGGL